MLVLSSWSLVFTSESVEDIGVSNLQDIFLKQTSYPQKAVKITKIALNMALQSRKGVYHVLDFFNAIVRY